MEIHPAVVRQTEAFVYPRPFERTHGVGVAGIANKQRRNIRTHVSGLGLYAAHPVLMGIVTALGEDVFRQVGNIENVNILVAVGLPKLRSLDEDVLFRVDIQKACCGKQVFVFLKTFNVEINRIAFAKLVNCFKSCHRLTLPKNLLTMSENR